MFDRSNLDIVVGSPWQLERVKASPMLSRFPIHYIPYGVDTRVYKPGRREITRAKFGIPPDADVIAFRSVPIGNNFKGTEYIETALMGYSPRKSTYLLTFEGVGGLEELRRKYTIVEMGWLNESREIADALGMADIFLMPSVAEAFGLMAVEAMACGVPVVVFEGTALSKTIDAPRSGIAVTYKDSRALCKAIENVMYNPEYRAELIGNALRHVAENHAFEAYASGYLSLYQKLVNDTHTSKRPIP
jgi:glycosyltransferase involved in cell wall biosynthesis